MSIDSTISCCIKCMEEFYSPPGFANYCSVKCEVNDKERLDILASIDILKEKMDILGKKVDYCSDTINALVERLY